MRAERLSDGLLDKHGNDLTLAVFAAAQDGLTEYHVGGRNSLGAGPGPSRYSGQHNSGILGRDHPVLDGAA